MREVLGAGVLECWSALVTPIVPATKTAVGCFAWRARGDRFSSFLRPASQLARPGSTQAQTAGRAMAPDAGELCFVGAARDPVRLKVSLAGDPATRLAMIVQDVSPGTVIPVHLHEREDEIILIQSGTGVASLGDVETQVGAGSVLWVPQGTWHGGRNTGSAILKWTGIYSPAGFEGYFREISRAAWRSATPAVGRGVGGARPAVRHPVSALTQVDQPADANAGSGSRHCQYHARMAPTPDGPARAPRLAGAPRVHRGRQQGGVISDGARAALGAAGILLVILVPAVLTLRTVEEGITRVQASNPTPYGYTISLLLYLVPIATLMTWFFRKHPRGSFRRRAFSWTIGLLAPMGFLLDLVFGNLFFSFPNAGATLQVFLPGYSFATGGLVYDLPIEEFIFYVSGFVAILLVYIWCNEVWVPAYGVADYGDTSRHPPYLFQLHWQSAVYGVIALAAAVAYKKMFASVSEMGDYREGLSAVLHVPAGRGGGAEPAALSLRAPVHQLAGLQHHAAVGAADQPALGSHAGQPVRMVALP